MRTIMNLSCTALSIAVVLTLHGCSLARIQKEVAEAKTLGLLLGDVASDEGTDQVFVLLFQKDETGVSVGGVAQLSEFQETWGFLGASGHRFYFGAFRDLDGDRVRDDGEPAAFYGDGEPIRLQAGQRRLGIRLELAKDAVLPDGFALDASDEEIPQQAGLRFAVGEIVSLDDERFTEDTAVKGMWQPLTQMTSGPGAGLYFLEPYDPDRIPVLFVHGIGGTPLDSRVLIERLDKKKFQAWIFHYPSGFRLHTIASALRKQLVPLCDRLGVETIYVVAHSMGGLISRGLIHDLVERPESRHLVKFLMTFASPIDGHPAATMGLKFTPEPVPAWIDMDPASDFVARIKQPLPADIPYYVFFGYDRSGNAFMRNSSDSVVDVSSQIPMWVQDQAVQIKGFDNDHMTILTDEDSVSRFLDILDEFEPVQP